MPPTVFPFTATRIIFLRLLFCPILHPSALYFDKGRRPPPISLHDDDSKCVSSSF
ncbi:hypothetical protein X777_09338 [Ooceraea biroi]|uniref:Uncharacterized protein n=1 Tax=Ooceraea biroi TaxID=2015173 RepID=A0A026X0C6_OOCBI|nr:hypothetical protein X777_09338 [Ooceraea biroi]